MPTVRPSGPVAAPSTRDVDAEDGVDAPQAPTTRPTPGHASDGFVSGGPSSTVADYIAPGTVNKAKVIFDRIALGDITRDTHPKHTKASSVAEADTDGTLLGRLDGESVIYGSRTRVDDVPPLEPEEGRTNDRLVIFVNGLDTDIPKNVMYAQGYANASGSPVVGLHNATVAAPFGWMRKGIDGIQANADLGDLNSQMKNPATAALTETLLSRLKEGKPINLVGYSQGAIITRNALTISKAIIDGTLPTSFSAADRRKMKEGFEEIQVETFGGAADRDWPKGPSYVHWVNIKDPVATGLGLGNDSHSSVWNKLRGALEMVGAKSKSTTTVDPATVEKIREGAGGEKATFAFVDSEFKNIPLAGGHNLNKNYLPDYMSFEDVKRISPYSGGVVVASNMGLQKLKDAGLSEGSAQFLFRTLPLLVSADGAKFDGFSNFLQQFRGRLTDQDQFDDFVVGIIEAEASEKLAYPLMSAFGKLPREVQYGTVRQIEGALNVTHLTAQERNALTKLVAYVREKGLAH